MTKIVVSLQAWGFALRATTPQVAFGYDPTGRSVLIKNDRCLAYGNPEIRKIKIVPDPVVLFVY